MRDATRVVRAGLPAPAQGAPFLPGPTFSGPYHLAGDPASSPYTYGRYHNPTWVLYERALQELEGGQVVVFASGMAAVAAVMGAVLRPGDSVVIPSDGYYTARLLVENYFAKIGVEVRTAPTAGNAQDSGVLVAVDNTTATVLGQRPLALGADFSVAADTKALTGHGDLVLGHVAAREPEWTQRLLSWRTQMGAIPGPMEVWLAHRSLATLDVRLERMCANALAIAQFLAGRPEVRRLRYPGLPSDPAHEVASRQMSKYGPIVSFELNGREAAERFLDACELVLQATSFGSVHTTAERRARWGGDKVSEGFIRLSAGCEHPDDLVADLSQALAEVL